MRRHILSKRILKENIFFDEMVHTIWENILFEGVYVYGNKDE